MYYLLSQGEDPTRLFFDETVAMTEGKEYSNAYLDIFDALGNKVKAYKLVDDGAGNMVWTTDF
jgi:hypothetical protein